MPTTKDLISAYMDEVERLETEARAKKRFRAIEGFPYWPHQFMRDTILVLIFTAALIYLGALAPYYLEGPADPAGQPLIILPDWYLLWSYGLLKLAVDVKIFGTVIMEGKLLGVLLNGVVVGFMVIVPFISRGAARRPVEAPAMAGYGVFGMLLGITLSAISINNLFYLIGSPEEGAPPPEGMTVGQFLGTDYYVRAGLHEFFHIFQTDVFSIICLTVPVLGGFVAYFYLKWRQNITTGQTAYENKLSASYYKIR
jgi:quinol-cytochrome oxidoreductase complex cytochrome b subunit